MSDSRPEISLSERAVDQLDDLETETTDRILSKLDDVTWNPDHYLRSLSGREGYRPRVGDYRVIVDWRRDDGEIFVREIGHRRNVYDRLSVTDHRRSPEMSVKCLRSTFRFRRSSIHVATPLLTNRDYVTTDLPFRSRLSRVHHHRLKD